MLRVKLVSGHRIVHLYSASARPLDMRISRPSKNRRSERSHSRAGAHGWTARWSGRSSIDVCQPHIAKSHRTSSSFAIS